MSTTKEENPCCVGCSAVRCSGRGKVREQCKTCTSKHRKVDEQKKKALEEMYDDKAERFRNVIINTVKVAKLAPQNSVAMKIAKDNAKELKKQMIWLDIRLKEFGEE